MRPYYIDSNGEDTNLVAKFEEFIGIYDQCRHFGVAIDNARHSQVDQVTLEKTKEFYEFGMQVWDVVIQVFRRDSESKLNDLDLTIVENEH